MNSTQQFSRAERMQRIGELLAKGIALMLTRPIVVKPCGHAPVGGDSGTSSEELGRARNGDNHLPPDFDASERAIVAYVQRVRAASPRDVQASCELSKATAYRKLNGLVQQNVLTRTGSTTGIRYRVCA